MAQVLAWQQPSFESRTFAIFFVNGWYFIKNFGYEVCLPIGISTMPRNVPRKTC